METIRSLQRKYDKELRSSSYSVLVLPKPEPYFNAYIPPKRSPYYDDDDILDYLRSSLIMFSDDDIDSMEHHRLLSLYDVFPINLGKFKNLVSIVMIEALETGKVEGKANSLAMSIRNPYYKFPTTTLNPEKVRIRREHRLIQRYGKEWEETEQLIHDTIVDYDLALGLLKKKYILEVASISSYQLNASFKRVPSLKDLFEEVRELSMSVKQRKRQRWNKNRTSDTFHSSRKEKE